MQTLTDNPTTREILQNSLNKRIEDGIASSQDALTLLEEESRLIEDHDVTFGAGISFYPHIADPKIKFDFKNGRDATYEPTKYSLSQLSQRLDLPTAYMKDLAFSPLYWKRELATKILNDHIVKGANDEHSLMRSVGTQARAFLSTSYLRLDPKMIYEGFLKGMEEHGAEIYRISIAPDSLKIYIEALHKDILELKTTAGLIHVALGCTLSHSDYGAGSLEVRTFILQPVCLNGLVTENTYRRIHRGADYNKNRMFSRVTMELDTIAQAHKMKDMLAYSFNTDNVLNHLNKIKDAVETPISYDTEIKKLEKVSITKTESQELKQILIDNKIEDGIGQTNGTNLWKLAQGLSAVARDKAVLRRKELETIAGSLIN